MRYKIIDDMPQGHGKKQVWIALNINELSLLSSMATEMSNHLPKTGPTARIHSVSKEMVREMNKCIKKLEKAGIDKRSNKLFPYDDRSVL